VPRVPKKRFANKQTSLWDSASPLFSHIDAPRLKGNSTQLLNFEQLRKTYRGGKLRVTHP
jgi:hypothetical protein